MVTRPEAELLLRTLFADPAAADRRARAELIPDPDPFVVSIGHQVAAIVMRDRGETDEALRHLRAGLGAARRSGDVERETDVRATLGATLAVGGRIRAGLVHLDRAALAVSGALRARVLYRRAWVLERLLADYEGSIADLQEALDEFVRAGDRDWEHQARTQLGLTLAATGDLEGAAEAFAETRRIATELGIHWGAAIAVHNSGWVAFLAGDLPLAFERYAEAAALLEDLDITIVDCVTDRCAALLAGGLAADALAVGEHALAARPLQARERADLLVAIAGAALAAGDVTRAAATADEARRLLRAQGRTRHVVGADLLALTARAQQGDHLARLLPRAERLTTSARAARAPELAQVLMLGAGLARRVRSSRATRLAGTWLSEAAGSRHARTALERALGWLAQAQRCELSGDTAGVLRACDRGLAALDEHRETLGSQELRAVGTRHGSALAELGTRTAMASGSPRRLLRWSERWRATALEVPQATQSGDPATSAALAALRAHHRRLAEARAAGEDTSILDQHGPGLERAVRERMLHRRGTGTTAEFRFDVVELLEALAADGTVLVQLVEVDGHLLALVAGRGRVRRVDVGPVAEADRAVDFALFSLRQAARGHRSSLDLAGVRLQRALLGTALDRVGEARVVISAPSSLTGVPWGMAPDLAACSVTSAPSARLWLRVREARPADPDRRVLLVGPGLESGGAEVQALAAQDPAAHVLDGDAATVAAGLSALDGAALAHIASHGHFRAESPLFSSLDLADGPLMVHDLAHLRRPPHRVVLSACESGELAPVGAQELLGLSAALLSMGTAGIVSSLGEVDDAATVEVMVALHAALRAGAGLGEALLAARTSAAGDLVLAATAASFTVLGA